MDIWLKFLFVACLISVPLSASAAPPDSVLLIAEGSWELVPTDDPEYKDLEKLIRCGVEPLNVTINIKAKRYTSQFGDKKEINKADILEFGENYIKIRYDNEERKMKNGKPQIWYMFFQSDDVFVWIMEDWVVDGEILGSTPARRRCAAPLA